MLLIKYYKKKNHLYTVEASTGSYNLYEDLILKYELLLKKEIKEEDFAQILEENQIYEAYYKALKSLDTKMRTEGELTKILQKSGYTLKEITPALNLLKDKGYINNARYIEAYIHDRISSSIDGPNKIKMDLTKLGFTLNEIEPFMAKIEPMVFQEKIQKYGLKKLKTNQKSAKEFKNYLKNDLLNKGFEIGDIMNFLDNIKIEEKEENIQKIVTKLYNKYSKKYDEKTTILKIKAYLYNKGYMDIQVEKYL